MTRGLTPRQNEIIKKCRNRGGDCGCPLHGECQAVIECSEVLHELHKEYRVIEGTIQEIETTFKRLRSPLASLTCELSPLEGYEPIVTFSPGEGADFGYINEDDDYLEGGIWPFDQEYIWWDDCERLGIRWEVV